jgi:hypothetical protein
MVWGWLLMPWCVLAAAVLGCRPADGGHDDMRVLD